MELPPDNDNNDSSDDGNEGEITMELFEAIMQAQNTAMNEEPIMGHATSPTPWPDDEAHEDDDDDEDAISYDSESGIPAVHTKQKQKQEHKHTHCRLFGHQDTIWRIVPSPIQSKFGVVIMATTSQDNTARIWDVDGGCELLCLRGHTSSILSFSFSSDGMLCATSSTDCTVLIWDIGPAIYEGVVLEEDTYESFFSVDRLGPMKPGKCRSVFGRDCASWRCAFSPLMGEYLLATAWNDGVIHFSNAATGDFLAECKGSGLVSGIKFSPNGQFLGSTSHDNTLRIWKIDRERHTNKFISVSIFVTLDIFAGETWRCDFSCDSTKVIAASSDLTVRMFDISPESEHKGELVHTMGPHYGHLWFCDFSHDGRLVVSNSNGGLEDCVAKLWDSATGDLLFDLVGNKSIIMNSTFSPNDKLLATACQSGETRVYSTVSGECLVAYDDHEDEVNGVAFSLDSSYIVTSSGDRSVVVRYNAFNVPSLFDLCVRCVKKTPHFFGKEMLIENVDECTYNEVFGRIYGYI